MDDDIQYRAATKADAETLARLHVASWREAYAGIVPPAVLATVDIDERIARWRAYLEDDGVCLLAQDQGRPVGFIRAGAVAEPLVEGADGHIFALYLLEAHHRRGIGRRLLGMTAAAWRDRDGRALSVGVLTANARAVRFYEALGAGFARTDTYRWNGHDLPESLYVFEDLAWLSRFA